MTYIIAEAGLNHNGSLDLAKQLVHVAKNAGCDAVKFQMRTVKHLATNDVLDALDDRFPEFGSTYREIREYHEFSNEEFIELRRLSKSLGLDFIVTPFDIEAVGRLLEIGIDKFKLASHSLTNIPLLQKISTLGIPVIMSTGMSSISEVDTSVEILKGKVELEIMHCISAYPTPNDLSNMRLISFYKDRYGLPVGYSGHEMGWLPSLVAVSLGATSVERHITLDKKMIGFDHKLSLEPRELDSMVEDIRNIELILGSTVRSVHELESITRKKYHVSAVTQKAYRAGEYISEEDLIFKNPGTGVGYFDAIELIKHPLNMDLESDTLLKSFMFKN